RRDLHMVGMDPCQGRAQQIVDVIGGKFRVRIEACDHGAAANMRLTYICRIPLAQQCEPIPEAVLGFLYSAMRGESLLARDLAIRPVAVADGTSDSLVALD